jgi:hypothetical protein
MQTTLELAEATRTYDALIVAASALCKQPTAWTRDTYSLAAHAMVQKQSRRMASDIETAALNADAAAYNTWFHSRPEERDALKAKWVYVLDQAVCLTAFEEEEAAFAQCLLSRKLGPLVALATCVSDSPLQLPKTRCVCDLNLLSASDSEKA